MIRMILATAALFALTPPPVIWKPSPNYTNSTRETTYNIDAIVIHTTEGSDTNGDGWYSECYTQAINWFLNSSSGVSAHYVVSPSGEITQMVADEDIGWHATYYNKRSIGIECAGFASKSNTWTPQLINALTGLVAWLCEKYNVPAIHPSDTALSMGGYLDVAGVVGHSQVQTSGSAAGSQYGAKSDPGPYFPWSSFMSGVVSQLSPASPVNLSALATLTGSTASGDFSWNAVAGADGYWLDIAKSDADLQSMTGTFQNAFTGTATSYSWPNLEAGTTYVWRVYAYNSYGGNHGYPSGPLVTPSPSPSGSGSSSSGGSSGGGCHAGPPDPRGAGGFALLVGVALLTLVTTRLLRPSRQS
jgi:N-acetyl-anhydromuramyl-L-alanine amidase AmpD